MSQINPQLLKYLKSPKTIRSHSNFVLDLAKNGDTLYFDFHAEKLEKAVSYVLNEIKRNYPEGNIPYHSRFRHLEMGGYNRLSLLQKNFSQGDKYEWGKALFEMIFISVLLDAGAGGQWSYHFIEEPYNEVFSRSEGLALASLQMFRQGYFSSDPQDPYRVDHKGLSKVKLVDLNMGFQVRDDNPLVGLTGRLALLHGLGSTLANHPHGLGPTVRLGDVYEHLYKTAIRDEAGTLSCVAIFESVLRHFGDIWPGGLSQHGCNLGDVGIHPLVKGPNGSDTFVPFHKLSQWLSYSLAEAFEIAGLKIIEVEQLTGLPEYRNGGLLIDLGLLKIKDPSVLQKPHKPQSEFIVEWRALTVAILDLIADGVREFMGKTQSELPLAKVLQGGTWSAGRRIAKNLRPGGEPPIRIDSDGTVF
ncbi:MAG: DUF1688 family protein [Oligoflexales bacterium]